MEGVQINYSDILIQHPRQVFARVLVLGRATNRLYTISEISDVLSASRQAVSKMIDETEAEGWAEAYRDNNRVQCQASTVLFLWGSC